MLSLSALASHVITASKTRYSTTHTFTAVPTYILEPYRRTPHRTNRDAPSTVSARAHSRSYSAQRIPSIMMTGTTIDRKDSVAMFQRTSSAAAPTKSPAAAAIHSAVRRFGSFRRASAPTAHTAITPAPIPARIHR